MSEHVEHLDDEDRHWPNEAVIRPHDSTEDGPALYRAAQIAASARPATTATYQVPPRPPVPPRPAEPDYATARGRVLAYLQARRGAWVDGSVLVTPEVGGINGTRRARELRAEGLVEIEPDPADSKRWLYRSL